MIPMTSTILDDAAAGDELLGGAAGDVVGVKVGINVGAGVKYVYEPIGNPTPAATAAAFDV